ncbi:MAG: hypothetical protein AUH85_14490 [Chloroflexi bacterium 13_1_40CM_4_68_4]|nr:MAG: hypothetical protein AUH85_14490 [Chloroflexi bacterium 13_1_40CM_4_68_4]
MIQPHQAAAATDVGKLRDHNEDRSLVDFRDGVLIVAVADGVGGEHGGDVASETAVKELAAAFFRRRQRDMGKNLSDAVAAVNDAVLGAAKEKDLKGAATTVVAAAIKDRRVTIVNLGDSRAYLFRNAVVRQVTKDHSGKVPRSITRFAGDPRGVRPDVFTEDLRPGDRLLLCSDGVTIHLSDRDLVSLLADGDAAFAAQRIVKEAVARGGRDNATAIVVIGAPRVIQWDFIAFGATLVLAILAVATTLWLVTQP